MRSRQRGDAAARIRSKMKSWGITASFLAGELGVSRQYAWQILHGRASLSETRANDIEGLVDRIIANRTHAGSFGERLRAARIASGLTLKQVADMIGYSWVGVERWEKNICLPKPGVLWHLFHLYGSREELGLDPVAVSIQRDTSRRSYRSAS